MRNRALIALAISVVLAVLVWMLILRGTDTALSRLDRIDAARAFCDSLYAGAQNEGDTLRILDTPLTDTIDSRSADAISTCGSLRRPE